MAGGSGMREAAGALIERRIRAMPPSRRLRFPLTLEALDRFAGDRPLKVLDAGCGEGLLSEMVARAHPDWTVVGVDVNEEMLARGRSWIERRGLRNADLRPHDVTQPLGDETFDAVVAIECLVEIEEDDAALRSMAAALRPGGLFVTHVPERNWQPVLPGSERTWRHEVRHGYGEDEIARKLELAGLRVTALSPTSHGTVRVAQELRDRIKHRGPKTLVATAGPLALSAWLERRGFTWGPSAALFIEAQRTLRQ